jgi:hypothetical protein
MEITGAALYFDGTTSTLTISSVSPNAGLTDQHRNRVFLLERPRLNGSGQLERNYYLEPFEDEEDYWSYHGHEYPFIGWEELT